MATVKVYFNHSAEKTISYVLTHGLENDPRSSFCCEPDEKSAAQSFADIRSVHHKEKGVEAIHVIQSFTHEESRKCDSSLFQKIGQELAQSYFPGHQYVCVTHTDDKHHHNHIVVNPVHFETGKRVHKKFKHLHELRKVSNNICLENKLSIPNQLAQDRKDKMPDKVQRMDRFGRFSQLMDLKQKADFARSYATSFDQYKGIMSELSIDVRMEKENITYFYPGAKRGKRGKNIGKDYDQKGLAESFKQNDEKFKNKWHVRDQIKGHIDGFKDQDFKLQVLKKNYSSYTEAPRREARLVSLPDEDLQKCMVPIDEIRKAKRTNIIDYCARTKIPLESKDEGKFVLKGRQHVTVDSYEWTNTRNNTKGSLIDLVAFHKNISYLHAVSEITGNQRLMLLEEHFGKQKPIYRTFYVPKSQKMKEPDAKAIFMQCATAHGFHPKAASGLYEKNQVQVSNEGMIRIFSENDGSAALEFVQTEKGEWKHSKVGKFKKPILQTHSKSSTAVVFLDFFKFIAQDHSKYTASKNDAHSTLVILDEPHKQIDIFIASNKHIRQLQIFETENGDSKSRERLFAQHLKERYSNLKIEIDFFSLDSPVKHKNLSIDFH